LAPTQGSQQTLYAGFVGLHKLSIKLQKCFIFALLQVEPINKKCKKRGGMGKIFFVIRKNAVYNAFVDKLIISLG